MWEHQEYLEKEKARLYSFEKDLRDLFNLMFNIVEITKIKNEYVNLLDICFKADDERVREVELQLRKYNHEMIDFLYLSLFAKYHQCENELKHFLQNKRFDKIFNYPEIKEFIHFFFLENRNGNVGHFIQFMEKEFYDRNKREIIENIAGCDLLNYRSLEFEKGLERYHAFLIMIWGMKRLIDCEIYQPAYLEHYTLVNSYKIWLETAYLFFKKIGAIKIN